MLKEAKEIVLKLLFRFKAYSVYHISFLRFKGKEVIQKPEGKDGMRSKQQNMDN